MWEMADLQLSSWYIALRSWWAQTCPISIPGCSSSHKCLSHFSCIPSPGLHTYSPWVFPNKGGVRFNNRGKAQGLFFALSRGNTKICQLKTKFRSPVARFSNISFWCMRNIDANPTARVTAEGENKFSIPCRQWNSAAQAREVVFCQMPTVDKCS